MQNRIIAGVGIDLICDDTGVGGGIAIVHFRDDKNGILRKRDFNTIFQPSVKVGT